MIDAHLAELSLVDLLAFLIAPVPVPLYQPVSETHWFLEVEFDSLVVLAFAYKHQLWFDELGPVLYDPVEAELLAHWPLLLEEFGNQEMCKYLIR